MPRPSAAVAARAVGDGIIYGALVALAQSDMKRLIAYSSVSHLGFCMLGLFALNALGVQGRRVADDQPRPVRPAGCSRSLA